ncbi:MAG: putative sulfate exporter family transporter [Prevotella sp.]|nr:putative sulfate exporter family transporter [Prevotella sp.]MCM1074507.1 putative sulfate exporter family transporter [Ruminococcus sp.]
MKKLGKALYWILLVLLLVPFEMFSSTGDPLVTPAIALFLGLIFAFVFGTPCPKFNKKLSKYLLQVSVVGLGFGMNLIQSLKSGADGMLFTVASVVIVMFAGIMLGKMMKINEKSSYLISSGTAICGGSAIAAVGPVVKANEHEMAVSLGVIFILNAIALFLFPPLGHYFEMSQSQFGTWAAIAIHDTSSVVGAGDAYGAEACEIATLIKCTRALWIIPLAFFTMWYFGREERTQAAPGEKRKVNIPWFIFYFVLAMVVNTYTPNILSGDALAGMQEVYHIIVVCAKKALVVVLFAIGASLSLSVVRKVGAKPLVLAILLWIIIAVLSFFVVMNVTE